MSFEKYRVDTGKAKVLTAAEVFLSNLHRMRRYRITLKSGEYMTGIPVWIPMVPDQEPQMSDKFVLNGDDDQVYLIPFSDLFRFEAE